ncbi:MAG: hypothetical protein ACFCU1_05595 [Sumerlaeia bacterium]
MNLILYPFKQIATAIFFPSNGTMRVLIWSASLIVVLLLSSYAAWQMGTVRYYYQGQPNDYKSNILRSGNFQLLNVLANSRMEGNLLDLPYYLNQPVERFTTGPLAEQWALLEDGSYKFSDTETIMQVTLGPNGEVQSYTIIAMGFDESLASNMMMRIRSRWSQPRVVLQPWTIDPLVGNTVAWWTNNLLIEVNWEKVQRVPYREKELTFKFEALANSHPEYNAKIQKFEAESKAPQP